MQRDVFSEEHELFREQFRRFAESEIVPKIAEWNARGMSDRETWRRAGEEGFLGANAARGSTAAPAATSSTTPIVMEELACAARPRA